MKIKEFVKTLKTFDQNLDITLGCDEELNVIYKDVQVALLGEDKRAIVMWGNSGSEWTGD